MILVRFLRLLKTYPALSAALANIVIALAAHFGFHVSMDQLLYVVGLASALLGVAVHSNVTPLAKLGQVLDASGRYFSEHGGYPGTASTTTGDVNIHNMEPRPEVKPSGNAPTEVSVWHDSNPTQQFQAMK